MMDSILQFLVALNVVVVNLIALVAGLTALLLYFRQGRQLKKTRREVRRHAAMCPGSHQAQPASAAPPVVVVAAPPGQQPPPPVS